MLALPALLTAASCGPSPAVAGPEQRETTARAMGVCPPFPLRDESGAVIDPVKGVIAEVPYSPRQTCGAQGCHDYAKITEGFHFTQGKGEAVPAALAGLALSTAILLGLRLGPPDGSARASDDGGSASHQAVSSRGDASARGS